MQHIELSLDPFYSESNIRYLEGMMDDIKSGKAKFSQHDLIEHIEDEYDKKYLMSMKMIKDKEN